MRKNIIWAILIIIVGLGAYYYQYQKARNTGQEIAPDRPITSGASAEVDYTDSGYQPQTIRVKVGATVNFVNASSNLMWIASDPHPTHTATPEFDARKGIGRDRIYSFTFNRTGTFRYHNHLVPGHTGAVIVE